MNDKPTQETEAELPDRQGRTPWQLHWDRPRAYVALVTAEYEGGREVKLCTYCLDRRDELHPRCWAPDCGCGWHAAGEGPVEGLVRSIGLVWRSAQPWGHPRMAPRSLIPDWLDDRSSRFRRKEKRVLSIFWLRRQEGNTGTPATPKASEPAAVPRPALSQAVLANSIYRRSQPPYRLQLLKTRRRKANPSPLRSRMAPNLRRVIALGACAGIAAMFLVAERVRSTSAPGAVHTVGTAMPTGEVQQLVFTTAIMPNGPVVPDQALPPCPPNSFANRGACWIPFGISKDDPPEDRKYYCYDLPNAWVLSYEDCMKNGQFFKPKLKGTPRSSVPETGKKP